MGWCAWPGGGGLQRDDPRDGWRSYVEPRIRDGL